MVMTHSQRYERRKTIAEAIREKRLTRREAANQFKVSIQYVSMCCSEYEVELPTPKQKQFNSYKIIALLINTNKTLVQIAGDFHISRQRVREIYIGCLDAGIRVNPRGR